MLTQSCVVATRVDHALDSRMQPRVGERKPAGHGAGHRDVRHFLSAHVDAGGSGAEALEGGAGGASGVGNAEELRGLVERVADGLVEGRGENSETRGGRGEQEEGMSAGDEQGKEREAQVSELRRGGSEEGSERMGLLLGRW